MPFTRPTDLPELAILDVNNGPLGAPNVQSPPTELREEGWDFGQKPEREFFNYYGRLYYLWLGYADQEITTLKTQMATIQDKNQNADLLFFSKW